MLAKIIIELFISLATIVGPTVLFLGGLEKVYSWEESGDQRDLESAKLYLMMSGVLALIILTAIS